MLKTLNEDIRLAIGKAFPQAKIYGEFVKKNFSRPGFFLRIKRMRARQELGNRYFFAVEWEIGYYLPVAGGGEPQSTYGDLNNAALVLYDALLLPGYLLSAMSHEIEDNVLRFSLTTSFYGTKGEEPEDHKEKMIEMKIEME